MLIKDAPAIWESLRSIVCLYKPPNTSTPWIRRAIIHAVVAELNEMDCRPPINQVCIEGDTSRQLRVTVTPSLADHPLVVGPRYQHEDLLCSWSNYLGFNTSGVLLLGIRNGTKTAKYIRENHSTRTYRVSGCLGEATENGFKGEKVVERSTWRFIKEYNIERLLGAMQASHQKEMFNSCGVDLQSQTAYDLAKQGPLRPLHSKMPVIYGIKCVEFNPPDFTIEIQCINEYETYLKSIIQEIGVKLHSTAHCTGIQCIRHSYFTLDNALLRKHWKLQNIVTNMEDCMRILDENECIVRQSSAVLQ